MFAVPVDTLRRLHAAHASTRLRQPDGLPGPDRERHHHLPAILTVQQVLRRRLLQDQEPQVRLRDMRRLQQQHDCRWRPPCHHLLRPPEAQLRCRQ